MFDVTDKRAVDRLAAVVVMLERREAEARQAYDTISRGLRGRSIETVKSMSQHEFTAEQISVNGARGRWTEAQEALAAARELARDL
jgi:hypothetical protein